MTKAGERILAGAREALAMVKAMKEHDERPALRGWCPGQYMVRCRTCLCQFAGDKRAYQCADCAYVPADAA